MKPIEGFKDYFVTEEGKVWSNKTVRFLKPEVRKEYLAVLLYKDHKAYHAPIHRLVAHAFVGGEFEGAVVNHLDGDKLNNKASNLEWTTISGNTQHAYDNGLTRHFTGSMKLSEEQLEYIRLNPSHKSQQKLADEFGVGQSTISRIVSRQLSY